MESRDRLILLLPMNWGRWHTWKVAPHCLGSGRSNLSDYVIIWFTIFVSRTQKCGSLPCPNLPYRGHLPALSLCRPCMTYRQRFLWKWILKMGGQELPWLLWKNQSIFPVYIAADFQWVLLDHENSLLTWRRQPADWQRSLSHKETPIAFLESLLFSFSELSYITKVAMLQIFLLNVFWPRIWAHKLRQQTSGPHLAWCLIPAFTFGNHWLKKKSKEWYSMVHRSQMKFKFLC